MSSDASEPRLPLPLLFKGKVRDVYAVPEAAGGGPRLLLLASDRVSAFDVVLGERVPDKGRVLTRITAWWLETLLADEPHHLITADDDEIERALPALASHRSVWEGRATLARRTEPLPVECVVRGYLTGSAWAEYRETGALAGEPLARDLVECGALEPAVFSPATKAREGHDENIPFQRAIDLLGEELARSVRDRSLAIYERGRAVALDAGIVVADTKFEFGVSPEGELLLIDEVLTPDSSRFWPLELYQPGRPQSSLDKQPLRDYLDALPDWDKRPPPPPLPASVVDATSQRYRDACLKLTGASPDARVRAPGSASAGTDRR